MNGLSVSSRPSYSIGAQHEGLHENAPAAEVVNADTPLRPIFLVLETAHHPISNLGGAMGQALEATAPLQTASNTQAEPLVA